MQIAKLNINLPQKKEEEFLKIDFAPLFDFDFKEHKVLDFSNNLELEKIKDDETYVSKLFSISNSLDNSKKVLSIKKDLSEPLIIVNTISFADDITIEYDTTAPLISDNYKIIGQRQISDSSCSIITSIHGK